MTVAEGARAPAIRAALDGAPPPLVAIVDYGMGNRRSVEKALDHVGARTLRSSDPAALEEADALVLPGVGAFPEAMRRLGKLRLDTLLHDRIAAGVPTLGICLGMQLGFERSTELGGADGLGILQGTVRELRANGNKLPHIGWNPVDWRAASPLRAGIPSGTAFYHVHSFVADTDRGVLATAEYGEEFVTAVAEGSFTGVQFHPEKSSTHGLEMLAAFVTVAAGCAR